MNIPREIIEHVEKNLENVTYFVKKGTETSSRGLRQGDPMSPILFNIYITGLQSFLADINSSKVPKIGRFYTSHQAFADDLVILAHYLKTLQIMLNYLGDFCTDRELIINAAKSGVMIMSDGRRFPIITEKGDGLLFPTLP